jgi:Fe-S cluster biogenesis protein NfuA
MTRFFAGATPDTSDVPQKASAEERVAALINILSDYIEHYHGGSVELVSFDGERLVVRMGGACEGCEFTQQTLDGWIASTIRPFFPNIQSVEALESK